MQLAGPQSPETANDAPGPPIVESTIQDENSEPITEEDLNLLTTENAGPSNDTEAELFPEQTVFKYPLDGKEKTVYENILKANREAISSLRKQLQESLAENESLKAEIEASK